MFMHVAEKTMDQADGLRRMIQPRPVKVIAVTGGKGGIGKSSVSVNLAITLARQNRNVMLMDADFGLANVDVLLGLNSRQNISHVIAGECSLEEVVVDGPSGLKIIPSASGNNSMLNLTTVEHGGLIRAFSELTHDVDVLLIDTAAGISESVVTYTRAAHEVIVVVCDEPASLTDAYALIKVLHRYHGVYRFHVLANMTSNAYDGRNLFGKLSKVAQRFLDVSLNYMGAVPQDAYLRKAVQRQQAVVDAFPRSSSSIAFRKLANKADEWPMPELASGQMEFFIERLVQPNGLA
jgi:flagellar biosynthesis protein FlhG